MEPVGKETEQAGTQDLAEEERRLLRRAFAKAYKHPCVLRVLDENGVTEEDFADPREEPLQ